jgi:tetratricopeptide (TPR) repeat protein
MEFRKYFFYTIVLFLTTNVSGQNQNYIDSLISVYESSDDTQIKLQVLSELCAEQSGADKRIEFAGVLLELAKKNRELNYTHYGNLQLGIGYRLKGDLPSSLKYLLNSVKIADQLKDEKLKGQSLGEISTTYASQGDIKNSVNYMNRAISIFRKSDDKKNLVVALMNTGYDYYTIDQYDSSLLYYNEAESIVPSLNETEKRKNSLLAYIRGNRGITWLAIDKDNEAISEISNSIQYLRSIDDEYAVADFLVFLGKAYIKTGQKIQAKEAATEAAEISKKLNLKEQQRDASYLLYLIAKDEGEANNALSHYQNYIEFSDSIENKNVIRQMTEQKAAY